jgi:hypothetical protein
VRPHGRRRGRRGANGTCGACLGRSGAADTVTRVDPATPTEPDAAALARRLRETEAELERVTLRLHRLENATSVRLALTLAAAARNPRKGLARLRARRGGGPAPGAAKVAGRAAAKGPTSPRREPAGDRLADRLLASSAVLVTTRDRPVLAVVADPATARAWSEDAHVQPLRPDDAPAVFAAVTPDVLVVDAAAGRTGPWSGLGTYAVPERDRTVLGLLRAARDRGVPVVLVPPVRPEEAPMLADARPLFSGEAGPGATVADLVAAGQVRA